jgi:hypothetical protein
MTKTNFPSFPQQNSTKIGVTGVLAKNSKSAKMADSAQKRANC